MASKLTQEEQAERYQQALAKKAARAKKARIRKKDSGLVEVRQWVPKTGSEFAGVIAVHVTADQLATIHDKASGQILYLGTSGQDMILKAKAPQKATELPLGSPEGGNAI